MAPCCIGSSVKEFTILLTHVLHTSHPAALEGSTRYAREIVDRFFLASIPTLTLVTLNPMITIFVT